MYIVRAPNSLFKLFLYCSSVHWNPNERKNMKTFLCVVTLFCFASLGLVSCASIETTISPIDNEDAIENEGVTEEVVVDDYNSDSAFNDVSDSFDGDSDGDDEDDNSEEVTSTEEIVSSSSTSSTTTTTTSTTTTTTTTTAKVDRSPKILKEPNRLQAFNPGTFLSTMLTSVVYVPISLWIY